MEKKYRNFRRNVHRINRFPPQILFKSATCDDCRPGGSVASRPLASSTDVDGWSRERSTAVDRLPLPRLPVDRCRFGFSPTTTGSEGFGGEIRNSIKPGNSTSSSHVSGRSGRPAATLLMSWITISALSLNIRANSISGSVSPEDRGSTSINMFSISIRDRSDPEVYRSIDPI